MVIEGPILCYRVRRIADLGRGFGDRSEAFFLVMVTLGEARSARDMPAKGVIG